MAKHPEEEESHYVNTVLSMHDELEGPAVGGLGKMLHLRRWEGDSPRIWGACFFSKDA